MKRKIVFLVALTLVMTAVLNLTGTESFSVTAAPEFQRVNFVSAQVTAGILNLREKPSVKAPIVCELKKNQVVKVIGILGDWYAVYEPTTKSVGAASSKYLQQVGSESSTPATSADSSAQASRLQPSTLPNVQTSATGSAGTSQDEQNLLALINNARESAGVSALEFDTALAKCARTKAKEMVDSNYFSHYSPTYGSPFDMMKQLGVAFKSAGENIAGNQTVDGAFKAWINSEGHKANILNGDYNCTGIGIVNSPTYGKIVVEDFIKK